MLRLLSTARGENVTSVEHKKVQLSENEYGVVSFVHPGS